MTEPEPAEIPDISDTRMREMIAQLKPDREVYAGRIFFGKLLEKRGVQGVLSFVDKASKALAKQDGLDYYYDFDADEKTVFNRTHLGIWQRREFLSTIGWALPGAVSLSYGGLSVLSRLSGARPQEKQQEPSHDNFDAGAKWVQRNLSPPGELLLGAALIHEGYEKWLEIKLEQIADALDLLREQVAQQQAEAKRSASTGR